MSMPDSDTQMVPIYHPGLKREALVPKISLHQHYMSGWVLIDETTPAEPPADPAPMTRAAVEADKATPAGEDGKTGDAPAGDPPPDPPGDPDPPAGKRAGRSKTDTGSE